MPPKRSGQKGKCSFCNRVTNEENNTEYGDVVRSKAFIAHYFCLLFSSGLNQNGDPDQEELRGFREDEVLQELKRGKRLNCAYCKTRGATIGCCRKSCSKTFHLPCGMNNKCLFQYFDEFGAWCPDHRPCQNIVPLQKSPAICLICTNHLDPEPSHEVLLMPCCRRSLHRDCLQKQALNAGSHFFKCCHCANKAQFQKEMLVCGIYIPEQDASWEREPNAFEDLLYQYRQCDAMRCNCPQGRQYSKDDSEWAVIRCYTCGAHGIHVLCGNLHKDSLGSHQWICPDCRVVCAPRVLRQRPPKAAVAPTPKKRTEERVARETKRAIVEEEDVMCKKRRLSDKVHLLDGPPESKRRDVTGPESAEKTFRGESSRLSAEEGENQTTGIGVVQETSLAGSSQCEAPATGPRKDLEAESTNASHPNGPTLRTRRPSNPDRVAASSASEEPFFLEENGLDCRAEEMHFCPEGGSKDMPEIELSPMKTQLQHALRGNIFAGLGLAKPSTSPSKKRQRRPRSKRSDASGSSWIQLSIVNFVRHLRQINR